MRKAWLRTSRYFWLACGFFVLGIIYGAFLPSISKPMADEALKIVSQKFAPLTSQFQQEDVIGRIRLILGNNLQAAGLTFLSGLLLILPAIFLFGNGMAVGLIGAGTISAGEFTPAGFVTVVLPHGLFELSALFLLAGLGWRFGLLIWRRLLGKRAREDFGLYFIDLVRLGLAALILLSVAALVEVLISPVFLPQGAI